MPAWAGSGSAAHYWKAAEGRCSRQNARTAVMIEFAVPKELSTEQQTELALAMAEMLASAISRDGKSQGKLPLTLAFHEGYGRNPHVHVLLSTSIADGRARSAQTWFGRHNPKHPHLGGARRSKYVTERGWLYRVRHAWATLANAALERHGLTARLDHRSYSAQGTRIEAQLHLGPAVAHMHRLGKATSRGKRFDEIEQRRLKDLELESVIARRRRMVRTLEIEQISLDRAAHDWQRGCDDTLRRLLEAHPLAADVAGSAMAMVLESDASVNVQASTEGQHTEAGIARLVKAVGASWLSVKSKRVWWAIRPQNGCVLMLDCSLAATDGDDEESVEVMIRAASQLALAHPKLVARDGVEELATRVLARLGLKWPVEGWTRRISDPNLRSRSQR